MASCITSNIQSGQNQHNIRVQAATKESVCVCVEGGGLIPMKYTHGLLPAENF
jgi:hypothetical protein